MAHVARVGKSHGTPKLTGTEVKVIECIATGCGTAGIAETLNVSVATVQWTVNRLMSKFGTSNTSRLVAEAYRHGVIGQ